MNTFHLRVVAHDEVYYDDQAISVNVPALTGKHQFLSGHEATVLAVVIGDIEVIDMAGNKLHAVCGNGFLEFDRKENSALLLVNTIERPEEIDVRRAREAKEQAEEALKQKQSIREYEQSKAALSRAMARLKEASRYKR